MMIYLHNVHRKHVWRSPQTGIISRPQMATADFGIIAWVLTPVVVLHLFQCCLVLFGFLLVVGCFLDKSKRTALQGQQ